MPKLFERPPKLLPAEKLLSDHSATPEPHHEYHSEEHEQYGGGYNPIKTLITWKAPARPFRKKDRSYYTTVALLIVLIGLIAFFAGEKLLIGVLLAIGFVVYVLNFVPPEEIENKISTQGITIGDHFYHWQELDSFWIDEKDGHKVLSVLTLIRFPGLLMLLLDNVDPEDIKTVCARFLPFHEIAPKSLVQKWSEGLQKHFPLENPHR
jgi:hypothetical protein